METNEITEKIIGCAIEVHRHLGPGLLESVCEKALAVEFETKRLCFENQKTIRVSYRERPIGEFRADLIVEDKVIVELKSVEKHEPVFEAQLLSYMKLGGYTIGLLINFNQTLLKHGIKRLIL